MRGLPARSASPLESESLTCVEFPSPAHKKRSTRIGNLKIPIVQEHNLGLDDFSFLIAVTYNAISFKT